VNGQIQELLALPDPIARYHARLEDKVDLLSHLPSRSEQDAHVREEKKASRCMPKGVDRNGRQQ
jgi:hypothetical protein